MMAQDDVLTIYHAGLRNAHAMEQEASQIIKRQLDRLENYPEVSDRLRLHLDETRQQQKRLEEILSAHDSSQSTLKDMAAGLIGNMAALGHTPAGDEILKNSFANFAFENYEIAAYRSLMLLAKAAGDTAAPRVLQASLDEEQKMAAWLEAHLQPITATFLQRIRAGQKADR